MNIKYTIVKNEMPASSAEAKYLGKVIPNGVRNRSQMTAEALRSEHFAEATFNAVIDTAVAITQELCAAGSDVDWGPCKFLAKMHGSMPCEDSSFADGTASLTLDADATSATRTLLDTLVPERISAAEIAQLIKVSNVMDVATEAFGTVVGSTPFLVLGNGITLDGEGEYVKALDKKTLEVKGTATVQSVSKGQRACMKFATQLAAGDYTFEIATKGLVGETTPRIIRKPVTAVYVPPVLKELKINSLTVDSMRVATLDVANYEGAVGYKDGSDGGPKRFQATYYVNDDATPHATEPFLSGNAFTANLEAGATGDTIRFVIAVDPAKTEWKQQPAEATAVVG